MNIRPVIRPVVPLLLMGLLNCGTSRPVGFNNQTNHTDQYLSDRWHNAQTLVATTRIQLNPLQTYNSTAVPVFANPDPRAYGAEPNGWLVKAVPDATPQQVFDITNVWMQAPTGLLVCPSPCTIDVTRAYTKLDGDGRGTYYALSLNDLDSVIEYEFESIILNQLHYDITWR